MSKITFVFIVMFRDKYKKHVCSWSNTCAGIADLVACAWKTYPLAAPFARRVLGSNLFVTKDFFAFPLKRIETVMHVETGEEEAKEVSTGVKLMLYEKVSVSLKLDAVSVASSSDAVTVGGL